MTEEQRQRARALLGQEGATPRTPSTSPQAPGTLPTAVLQMLQGMPQSKPYLKSFRGVQFAEPPATAERELRMDAAKRLLKDAYPTSTVAERRSTRISRVGLKGVRDIRQLLQVDAKQGTVKNREPISVTYPPTQGHAQFYMTPAQKKLRDRLNKVWDLTAMLRTGVAGEKIQKESLKAQSNIGEFDEDSTIIDRLSQLEAELRAFAVGDMNSPVDSAEMSEDALKRLLQND